MARKRRGLIAVAGLAALAGPAGAAEPEQGKRLFDRYCAECHAPGPGHAGTQALGATRGEQAAVLEQRRDLTPGYIIQTVRNGLVEMPPFRPTEIDDATLQQLAAWLARAR